MSDDDKTAADDDASPILWTSDEGRAQIEASSHRGTNDRHTYHDLKTVALHELGKVSTKFREQDPDDDESGPQPYARVRVHGVDPETWEELPGKEWSGEDGEVHGKTLRHGPKTRQSLTFFRGD